MACVGAGTGYVGACMARVGAGYRRGFFALAFLIACSLPAISAVGDSSNCSFDFTGPSDDVFIMDRSKSVNKNNFAHMKEFIGEIIHHFFKLRPQQNRIAIVTYNDHVTVAFDFISNPTTAECELFLDGGYWDTDVVFDINAGGSPRGQKFKDAFSRAQNILASSSRSTDSDVIKRIWIFSDLETETELPLVNTDARLDNVLIYGFGIGAYLNMTNFEQITSPNQCHALSKTAWDMKLQDIIRINGDTVSKTDNKAVDVTNDSLCGDCPHGCQCQEFNQRDYPQCKDKPEEDESKEKNGGGVMDGFIWWIVIAAAGGVILLSLSIIVCACVTRRRRRKREEKKMRKFTEPIAGMPEPSPFTVTIPTTPTPPNHPDVIPIYRPQPVDDEDLYVNGTLQRDLLAHGVQLANSDKKTVNPVKPSKSKLYIKNQASVDATVPQRFNPTSVPKPGHSRQMSDVSIASSVPSYIAPVPDSEYGNDSRQVSVLDYSEPYMDIHPNIRNGGLKTTGSESHKYYDRHIPASTSPDAHKYELCTFPLAKKDERVKRENESAATSTELLEKLTKSKQLLRPISKQLSFKTQSAKDVSTAKVDESPKLKPKTLKIEQSGRDYINIEEPEQNLGDESQGVQTQQNRSSKKLGTGKFNAIRAMLDQNKKATEDQLDIRNFSKIL